MLKLQRNPNMDLIYGTTKGSWVVAAHPLWMIVNSTEGQRWKISVSLAMMEILFAERCQQLANVGLLEARFPTRKAAAEALELFLESEGKSAEAKA